MLMISPLWLYHTVPEEPLCAFHPPFGQGCHDLILPSLLPITGKLLDKGYLWVLALA